MAGSESGNEIQRKVFNDPIHGHVELHPLLVKIIDTPQFQRLRNIKQLGGGYFVYPGACHNRFEHSIGVAHLAGELAKALKSRQPELNITDRDILCVQIAGLCHDLGHGPFSHLFDGMFIPETCKGQKRWKHEDASIEMFDHLVESNNLTEVMRMKPYSLDENDEIFIKEMIKPVENASAQAEWPYKGRRRDKSFLYEIVSNKRNGIDVDKFDYFARDCHHLGIQNNFDHWRFIKLARVCEAQGEKQICSRDEEKKPVKRSCSSDNDEKPVKQICSRDKEVGNLYNMFHTRNYLHRRAYQHRVNDSIQIMIKDAFMKADDHIKIRGSNGKMFKLSEAKNNMEAYSKLTDHLFEHILYSDTEDLKEAREILQRIVSRKLYKFVGEALEEEEEEKKRKKKSVKKEQQDAKDTWKKELTEALKAKISPDDFEVVFATFDYGMKNEDPLAETYFYKKEDVTKAYPINKSQVPRYRPERFSENVIRVYWKNIDETNLETAKDKFRGWCRSNRFQELRDLDDEGQNQGQN
ncbi:deoxynucleoside triphosphate triphosphohydrolase SAMHD1-like [Mugil cephalus]|uniref:deoxynucleoside triphosphate triphosphohydrolase SAMHD1-like n=1 Tax=Mugil cephalus TaxID=48193 RepID=UPI001FB69D1C|nr:deoxynucleoside triphosphate triphosphohydrolase SAMHD1-like [Mugil cephalus]XP_047445402.1 deoxynucleoside triphosphate triphosphohydrolase SAMHD1-like [Mugil cephalus]